jgi:hypothetical protein
MAFSKGQITVSLEDILHYITEGEIAAYYLGINAVPCVINSPLREDRHPSLGVYSPDGKKIHYTDFATNESGSIFDLLSKMWNLSFNDVLVRIYKECLYTKSNIKIHKNVDRLNISVGKSSSDLQCKVREWRNYDVDYWEQYGISIKWLKYAEVYPISHKIIIKNKCKYVLNADKLAYAYVEHKEGKITLKIYQPYNKNGYKWSNKHDKSVISLWTKVPATGINICICSSLKDALCLWANTGIPSIAIQGEAYKMSNTAINELKRRFKYIFILLDNDEPGIRDAEQLSKETGFINVVLPQFEGGKDISDYYKVLNNKELFKETIIALFRAQVINHSKN